VHRHVHAQEHPDIVRNERLATVVAALDDSRSRLAADVRGTTILATALRREVERYGSLADAMAGIVEIRALTKKCAEIEAARSAAVTASEAANRARDDAVRRETAAAALIKSLLSPAVLARNATALLTAGTAAAYLRVMGFPAGSKAAGITAGLSRVPASALEATSVAAGGHCVNPGCRLLYDKVDGEHRVFCTKAPHALPQSMTLTSHADIVVTGVLVQGYPDECPSKPGDAKSWHTVRFVIQTVTEGTVSWSAVPRVFNRSGMRNCDVLACVFAEPVHCRAVRMMAEAEGSGYARWEVVLAEGSGDVTLPPPRPAAGLRSLY